MGNGVPNQGNDSIFEPLSGDFLVRISFSQHFDLTASQWNACRTAVVNAGGMSNVAMAYTALRGAMDGIESGRDAWLDRMTTGTNGTETDALREGQVWRFTWGAIPSLP
jgi:hypothetical protein